MGAEAAAKKVATGIVIVLLLATSAPITAGETGPDVGEYVQESVIYDLTEDDIDAVGDALIAKAPSAASEMRVNPKYIEDRLGDWAADRAYTLSGDRIVVDASNVTFTPFAPGPDEVFTSGSDDSLRFLDRPMWVSVHETTDGLNITAYDGDPAGQETRFSDAWLAGYGIERPLTVHEDGSVLPLRDTTDGNGSVVDVPHFSTLQIIDPSLDTSWKQEGYTIRYEATGPVGTLEFKVVVSNVTDDTVGFEAWVTLNNGTEYPMDNETWSNVSRESIHRPNHFSPFHINETILDVLREAPMMRTLYNLTDVTTTSYVFTRDGGNLTYHYDRDHGWLRKVVDERSGAEISAYSWGTGSVPEEDVAVRLSDPVILVLASVAGPPDSSEGDECSVLGLEDCVGWIQPGALMIEPSWCTLNFIFRDASATEGNETLYVGTAGHCFDELGQDVHVRGIDGPIGTAVFILDGCTGDCPPGKDFGLIEIDPSFYEDRVDPSVRVWGGPLRSGTPELGTVVFAHGHGRGGQNVTDLPNASRSRAGVVRDANETRVNYHSATSGGDSGMPVMTKNGTAVGIHSQSILFPCPVGTCSGAPVGVIQTATLVAHAAASASDELGIELALVTANERVSPLT